MTGELGKMPIFVWARDDGGLDVRVGENGLSFTMAQIVGLKNEVIGLAAVTPTLRGEGRIGVFNFEHIQLRWQPERRVFGLFIWDCYSGGHETLLPEFWQTSEVIWEPNWNNEEAQERFWRASREKSDD